jgi:hypothetical protein
MGGHEEDVNRILRSLGADLKVRVWIKPPGRELHEPSTNQAFAKIFWVTAAQKLKVVVYHA